MYEAIPLRWESSALENRYANVFKALAKLYLQVFLAHVFVHWTLQNKMDIVVLVLHKAEQVPLFGPLENRFLCEYKLLPSLKLFNESLIIYIHIHIYIYVYIYLFQIFLQVSAWFYKSIKYVSINTYLSLPGIFSNHFWSKEFISFCQRSKKLVSLVTHSDEQNCSKPRSDGTTFSFVCQQSFTPCLIFIISYALCGSRGCGILRKCNQCFTDLKVARMDNGYPPVSLQTMVLGICLNTFKNFFNANMCTYSIVSQLSAPLILDAYRRIGCTCESNSLKKGSHEI